jgi:O-antigen/teichoic acid export membrane protein
MRLAERISKNIIYKTGGELGVRLFALLVNVMIIRSLRAVEYGYYSIAFAFTAIFVFIADLGINNYQIRALSQNRQERQFIISTLYLKFILGLGYLLVINVFFIFMNYPMRMIIVINLMSLAMLGQVWLDYFGSIFIGLEVIQYESMIKLIQKIFMVLLVGGVILYCRSLENIIIATIISNVLILPWAYYFLVNYIRALRLAVSFMELKAVLLAALPLGLFSIFSIIYSRIDVVLLSWLNRPLAEIGWYSSVIKLIESIKVLPFVLSVALFPVLAHLSNQDRNRFEEVTTKSIKLFFLLTCPLSMAIYILAQPLILFLYGENFLQAVPVLRIMCWGVVFFSLNQLLWVLFFSLKLEKKALFISGAVLVINICLNIYMIPHLGYRGASWSLISSEAVLALLNIYYLRNHLPLKHIYKSLSKILWCALVVSLYLWLIRLWPWTVIIVSGTSLYGIMLYWAKAVNKDDLLLFKSVIGIVQGYKISRSSD